jgi:hypothetical protein
LSQEKEKMVSQTSVSNRAPQLDFRESWNNFHHSTVDMETSSSLSSRHLQGVAR